ncbi:MAG TPA: sugar phosphate nucleotidyltransferase [Cyclobacteriaceae bacterium]|jgi:UTP-glucose-1-phosphate uridylyltransferase|nr:sugar phosphate nucleotidyltransferase [Cyclobacteriaceae bacterium]
MAAQNRLTLLVLAAGMGSRYGGIKQIDGFGPSGETIMDYSLFDAIRAGFTKIVFIVRDEIRDTVADMFLPRLRGKVDVEFVIQSLTTFVPKEFHNTGRTKPWGTSHAMLCAKEVINEPFAVINADDFYGLEAFAATSEFFKNETSTHAMVGYTLKNVLSDHGSVSRGCGERDANGFLKSVVERTTIVRENGKIVSKEKDGDLMMDPETPTSMNFWGFHPSIFSLTEQKFHSFLKDNSSNVKSEFFIPLVVNDMIKKNEGKVKVISGGSTWFGVTYKEDKDAVSQKINQLVAAGKYPSKLW